MRSLIFWFCFVLFYLALYPGLKKNRGKQVLVLPNFHSMSGQALHLKMALLAAQWEVIQDQTNPVARALAEFYVLDKGNYLEKSMKEENNCP